MTLFDSYYFHKFIGQRKLSLFAVSHSVAKIQHKTKKTLFIHISSVVGLQTVHCGVRKFNSNSNSCNNRRL